ncbi:MAG: hypothetical protein WC683_09660 [bacterium]
MARAGSWIKFYPDDWNNDVALMSCSLKSQAVFIRLFSVLIRSEPYGFLVQNGCKMNAKQLSNVLGLNTKQIQNALDELLKAGVLKQDKRGIYSKRMVLDQQRREQAQEYGKKGGNPWLVKGGVKGGVNPMDNLDTEADTDTEAEADTEGKPSDLFSAIPESVKTRLRGWIHNSNAVWNGVALEAANGTPEEWLLAAIEAAENANACKWSYLKAAIAGIKADGGPGPKKTKPAGQPAYTFGTLNAVCAVCGVEDICEKRNGEWLCEKCYKREATA